MNTTLTATAITAPTQYVDAAGIRFAYRRFGNPAGLPLVHLQHFIGTLENWDPQVLDALAQDREIIIFDNRGIASTDGETPTSIAAIAQDAAAFLEALGLKQIDLFGYSMGGMVAQQLTLDHPALVRRLILIGTAPRGGHEIDDFTPEVWAIFAKEFPSPYEVLLETLFTPSVASQQAGHKFLGRIRARVEDRDSEIGAQVAPAQVAAIAGWAKTTPGDYSYLKAIKQPVFVLVGGNDIIFPPFNSYLLQQNLPDAQLIVYPDANHGPQYQYPELFVKQLTLFLDGVH
jgi:pimeloyl-ACP methyl ester carboxylesterase